MNQRDREQLQMYGLKSFGIFAAGLLLLAVFPPAGAVLLAWGAIRLVGTLGPPWVRGRLGIEDGSLDRGAAGEASVRGSGRLSWAMRSHAPWTTCRGAETRVFHDADGRRVYCSNCGERLRR